MEPEQEEVVPAFSDLIRKIRGQRRIRAGEMEAAILSLGVERYITAQELAEILQRSAVTIKNHYIARLVAQGKMEPRFPEQPTHPAQAYRATTENKDEAEKS
jgi:predicted ArsR family transcriptional regulator